MHNDHGHIICLAIIMYILKAFYSASGDMFKHSVFNNNYSPNYKKGNIIFLTARCHIYMSDLVPIKN